MKIIATFLLAVFIGAAILNSTPSATKTIAKSTNRLLEKPNEAPPLSENHEDYAVFFWSAIFASTTSLYGLLLLSSSISQRRRAEINSWQQKHESLEAESSRNEFLAREKGVTIKSLKSEHAKLQDRIADLEDSSVLAERLKVTTEKCERRSEHIEKLRGDIESLRKKHEELRTEKDTLAVENSRLKEAIKYLPKEDQLQERWKLQEDLGQEKAKSAALQAQVDAEDKLGVDQQVHEDLIAEKARLAGINRQLRREMARIRKRSGKSDKLLAQLLNLVDRSSRQLKKTREVSKAILNAASRTSGLEEKIDPLAGFIQELEKRMEESLSDLHQQLSNLGPLATRNQSQTSEDSCDLTHGRSVQEAANRVFSNEYIG